MFRDILLPYEKRESMGRLLFPASDSPLIENAFDGLRSVYRTADNLSVSFVTDVKEKDGAEDRRLTMSLPDFVEFIMNDGRENPNLLTEQELTSIVELGFDPEGIEVAVLAAINHNNLQNR